MNRNMGWRPCAWSCMGCAGSRVFPGRAWRGRFCKKSGASVYSIRMNPPMTYTPPLHTTAACMPLNRPTFTCGVLWMRCMEWVVSIERRCKNSRTSSKESSHHVDSSIAYHSCMKASEQAYIHLWFAMDEVYGMGGFNRRITTV